MLVVTHWRIGLVAMEILLDLAAISIMGYLTRYPDPILLDISAESLQDGLQAGLTLGFRILVWIILVMTIVELIKHVRIAFRLQRNE